jgi:1,4-alpha-glucan branching enzyme
MNQAVLDRAAVAALCAARHGDPFAVLGMHADASGALWVRTLQPGARRVEVLDAAGRVVGELALRREHGDASPSDSVAADDAAASGFFEGRLARRRQRFAYRLRVF